MSNSIDRRNFLKASAALTAMAGVGNVVRADDKKQEYYELCFYRTADANKKKMLDRYLENALIPALGRMGLDRIGVFTNMDQPDDYSIYLLIPYPTLEIFAAVKPMLAVDKEYLITSKDYFAVPMDDPVFIRIQSTFYKAFQGMLVIEMPDQTAENKPRIFELRIYESHTEEKAAFKVDMFNSGEIQVMRDTGLAPVFYGEALVGENIPHLAYMLSASNRDAHKEHWGKFGAHPEWQRMKEMPKYKDTVSKITNFFLKPTAYSQI
ncbi:NIPSNAP family protein [candidate division KSB1 bacterium]|nr:NIPSNAP family protein [candidate division KSB1 bacterium]